MKLIKAERETGSLSESAIRQLIAQAFEPISLEGKRVLIIIPDSTRTAPIPLFFRLFHRVLSGRVA
ncbi:MAG: hypothetical protein PVH95_14775, partial [Anaerolineae bacterium]